MTLTTDILRTWFRQFNTDYFGSELPMPRIVLSKARTRLGTMACKCTRRLMKRVYTDFTIRISTYYECTEREFQETLLHEMIHYYIMYKHIPDTSSHGKVFREIMHRLNSRYGWHITVSSSMRGRKIADEHGRSRRSAFLVLAIVLDDGSRMLSVVSPLSARKLDVMAQGVKEIVDHRWYLSSDPYFADFSKVRSLRARRVDQDLFNEKTAAMQPLVLPK